MEEKEPMEARDPTEATGRRKSPSGRNPFPGEPFFIVPIKLYDSGLVKNLTGNEHKRYNTFLRLANYKKQRNFKTTLPELEEHDGVSPRRAHEVHARLQERGMLIVDRSTSPYTYQLTFPTEWHERGKTKPIVSMPSWSELGDS